MLLCLSVIGASSCSIREYEIARNLGREIALRKAVLICGGLGGVMEAAARGAKDAGGVTVGILPGTDKREANSFIDIPVATGMGEARNIIVALSGSAVIAVGGKLGTLSELAVALKHGKPVIGLSTWSLDKEYCQDANIFKASGPEEAVDKAFELIENPEKRGTR